MSEQEELEPPVCPLCNAAMERAVWVNDIGDLTWGWECDCPRWSDVEPKCDGPY